MKRCVKCVLPSTFPGVEFDEKGVCNYCRLPHQAADGKEKEVCFLKFKNLVERLKGRQEYDCILAFSGGRDSAFTLYLLRKIFKLNILALTFDNGFLSPTARYNIRACCDALGADSMVLKPDRTLLRRLFNALSTHSYFPPRAIPRTNPICTSCRGLIKYSFLKIAIEKHIPLIAWGRNRYQVPLRAAAVHLSPPMTRSMQSVLRATLVRAAGNEIERFFLPEEAFHSGTLFPYTVNPLLFMPYADDDIAAILTGIGWQPTENEYGHTKGCLLHAFAEKAHRKRFGFPSDAAEVAAMVRSGALSRSEGIRRLGVIGPEEEVVQAEKILGLIPSEAYAAAVPP